MVDTKKLLELRNIYCKNLESIEELKKLAGNNRICLKEDNKVYYLGNAKDIPNVLISVQISKKTLEEVLRIMKRNSGKEISVILPAKWTGKFLEEKLFFYSKEKKRIGVNISVPVYSVFSYPKLIVKGNQKLSDVQWVWRKLLGVRLRLPENGEELKVDVGYRLCLILVDIQSREKSFSLYPVCEKDALVVVIPHYGDGISLRNPRVFVNSVAIGINEIEKEYNKRFGEYDLIYRGVKEIKENCLKRLLFQIYS